MNLSDCFKTVDGDLVFPDFSPVLEHADRWLDKVPGVVGEEFWWRFERRFVMWQIPLAMGESEAERRDAKLAWRKHAN